MAELDLLGAGGGLKAGVGGGRGLGLGQVQGVDGHVPPISLVHPVISAGTERNIMIDRPHRIETLPVVVFKVLKFSVRLGIPDPHW